MTHSIHTLSRDMSTDMYLTFLDAFSDYLIPFKMSKKRFDDKFIEKLGIDFNLSIGAFDDKSGLSGFILTSVGSYLGKETAYNGGTGVRPRSRGRQLTKKMYEYLLPLLKDRGVEQCTLEVLTKNFKALDVYKKLGFEIYRQLRCYKLKGKITLDGDSAYDISVASTPQWSLYESFFDYSPSYLDSVRLNQNIRKERILEARQNGQCVGYAIFQPSLGRISQLAVSKQHRNQGIGRSLIHTIQKQSDNKPITMLNVPEDAKDTNIFFDHLGFLNEIDQYEMILPL